MQSVRSWSILVLVAIALFASLTWSLRRAEWRAVHAVVDEHARTERLSVAEVASAVRRLNLVTVELVTSVESESLSESWRGDVRAAVSAPAVFHYGVDLSKLEAHRIGYSPASSAYVVRVPIPKRVALEVLGQDEQFAVTTGWLRSRSMAGEYHLGLARRGLYDAAQHLTLAPEDAARVRDLSRTQIASLIGKIVGPGRVVSVAFQDEP